MPSCVTTSSKPSSDFYDPVIQAIEGWTVAVDPRLLKGPHAAKGRKSLQALEDRLRMIRLIVGKKALVGLQEVKVWIELEHGGQTFNQYHGDVKWLIKNNYDPRMVGHVHISSAAILLSRKSLARHPYVILHELAHGYHFQILPDGYNEPRIKAAYEAAVKAGNYEKVLSYQG